MRKMYDTKLIASAAVVCLFFGSVATVFAQGKVVEGTGEIVTSPAEVPKGMAEGAEQQGPVVGTAAGAVRGAGGTGEQATKGAGNVVEGTGEAVSKTLNAVTGGE